MSESDCLFCKIVAGTIPATVVHRTDHTVAFRDINPQAKTHVLVVPTEHYEDAAALAAGSPELLAELHTAGAEVAKSEGIEQSGYRFVFNTGPDAGRTVFHAHLHVLGGEQLGLFGRPHPAS
ncbi:MAG TPA: histidine triad nucleotide-binding protein [Pseudonocardiaceae bacterium]|jgi:histidine triad (HIT) family protein|nr:histidine triad nucleotide-binding protein [Pseudonocardiaceae bacterium]